MILNWSPLASLALKPNDNIGRYELCLAEDGIMFIKDRDWSSSAASVDTFEHQEGHESHEGNEEVKRIWIV